MSSWQHLAGSDSQRVQRELIALFSDRLNVEVPSETTDLFESGILDSQKFVELLLHIEEQFQTPIDIADFDMENFRCVEKIADLILRRRNGSSSHSGPS
jgi:methoxymalonate biosynthesis acyl carrier protein